MSLGCFYHIAYFPGWRISWRKKEGAAKDKLTSCKTCSKEAAQSATVCPHCGAKLKMNLIEKLVLFVIVSFIAIFLVSAIGIRWVK